MERRSMLFHVSCRLSGHRRFAVGHEFETTRPHDETLIPRGRAFDLLIQPLEQCGDTTRLARLCRLLVSPTDAVFNTAQGLRTDAGSSASTLWLFALDLAMRDSQCRTRSEAPLHESDWRMPIPVLAERFSGNLRSGRGKAKHTGMYGIDWPCDRDFHIERGLVTGSTLIDNRKKFPGRRKGGTSCGGNTGCPSVLSTRDNPRALVSLAVSQTPESPMG